MSFSPINLLNDPCSLIQLTRSCRFNPDQAWTHVPSSPKLTRESDMHAGFILLGWFILAAGEQKTSDPV